MPTPIPGYTLRPAQRQDIPAIHDLMLEMAAFEKLTDIFEATHTSLEKSFFGDDSTAHCLVITPDAAHARPIAYIMWFYNYSSFLDRRGLYLEDIYITPAHRGQGLGGWVLKHLAAHAVAQNCGRFEWVVLDWNENAQQFYTHHGAEVLDEWRIVRVTGDALRQLAAQDT